MAESPFAFRLSDLVVEVGLNGTASTNRINTIGWFAYQQPNPVSAMVTFELFVRPTLLKTLGHQRLERPRVVARALAPIENPGRRRGYLRVTLTPEERGSGARLTGDQGSGILRSMVAADGLAVVPGDTTIPPGGDVAVIVLRGG